MTTQFHGSCKWFAVFLFASAMCLAAGTARAHNLGDYIDHVRGGEESSWNGFNEDDPVYLEDASLGSGSNELSDAYDDFWEMYVDGHAYNPTTGLDLAATEFGAVVTAGLFETNGIRSRQKFVTYSNSAILGVLYCIWNVSGVATTVNLEVRGNVGSDSDTTNELTSSGDAIFDTNDTWLITGGDSSDPINGFVYGHAGAALSPTGVYAETFDDNISVYYSVPLAVGEAKYFLFFSQLSTNTNSAIDRIQIFEDVFAMQERGLFIGFSGRELKGVCNWLLPDWESLNDLDGDGISDLTVLHDSAYVWYTLKSSEGYLQKQLGGAGMLPVAGDYDGDGQTDHAVYDPSSGTWYLSQSTAGDASQQFGFGSVIPAPADYDGDGQTDFAVYDSDAAIWYLLRSAYGFVNVAFGSVGGQPVSGDFDGNGSSDLATYDPESGRWDILFTNTGTPNYNQLFGIPGYIPVPADYDGDGATDIAVYSPGDGMWYIQGTSAGFWSQQFGFAGVWPVPGDYDGDKVHEVGVYDPVGLNWYTIGSFGGFRGVFFGVPDSTPIGGLE